MKQWGWWECSNCGTVFFGKLTKDGFVNEEELRKPKEFWAYGCAYCGYTEGEVLPWDYVAYLEGVDA